MARHFRPDDDTDVWPLGSLPPVPPTDRPTAKPQSRWNYDFIQKWWFWVIVAVTILFLFLPSPGPEYQPCPSVDTSTTTTTPEGTS